MDWSHDLLPETERLVLRRLAVFRGNFTMAIASTVISDERLTTYGVIEGIVNLAMKSLVTSKVGGAVTYFRLLETTRAYALERLQESGEWQTFTRRHAEFHRDLLSNAECELAARAHEWLSLYGDRIDD
jgi:predicted ATPase